MTLGVGVMVIPVELSTSGLWTILYIQLIPLLAEICCVIVFMELLQKVRIKLTQENEKSDQNSGEVVEFYSSDKLPKRIIIPIFEDALNFDDTSSESSFYDDDLFFESNIVDTKTSTHTNVVDDKTESLLPRKSQLIRFSSEPRRSEDDDVISKTFLSKGVDLPAISTAYFAWWYSLFVDFITFTKVLPTLYIIGSSQTFVNLFWNDGSKISTLARTLSPFISLFGFALVFSFGHWIDSFVSIFAAFKAFTIFLIVALGFFIMESITTKTYFLEFTRVYFAETLLISGSILFIPQLFSKLKPTKKNVIMFTTSIISGLVVCQFFCMLWSICIWGIVPQDDRTGSEINLKRALENGELANIPYTQLVRQKYPSFAWIGSLVDVFTLISYMVSFLLHVSITKSMIDGYTKSIVTWTNRKFRKDTYENGTNQITTIREENEDHERMNEPKKRKWIWNLRFCHSTWWMVTFFQVFGFISVALFVSIISWILFPFQYLMSEISAFSMVLFYLFFVCGILWVEILRNPMKDVRPWMGLKRKYFVILSVLLGLYFLVYSVWCYSYYTVRWIMMIRK